MLKNQQSHGMPHFVRIGLSLKYGISNSGRIQKGRVTKVYEWRNTHTYFVFEDVKRIDSGLGIGIGILLDIRKVVKCSFMRQDQVKIPLNHLQSFMSNFNSIEVESESTVLQASELVKETS